MTASMAIAKCPLVRRHTDLDVYKIAFDLAMQLFELSKSFPAEEHYSLTDQMRRASRSVCANIAEGWRQRCYQAAFVSKREDFEAEETETQTWTQFAVECKCLDRKVGRDLYREYDFVLGKLVLMITHAKDWIL